MSKYHKRMVHRLGALYNDYCEENEDKVRIRCVHDADVSSDQIVTNKNGASPLKKFNNAYKKLVRLCKIS